MAQNSKIEWTDHTVNLWHGCTRVHAGCDHCYAETLAHRWGNDIWGNDKPRKLINTAFSDLDKYQKEANSAGKVAKVFIGSMMDIFEKPFPLIDSKGNKVEDMTTENLRYTLLHSIKSNLYNKLFFQFLTKRPSNILKYIPLAWHKYAPSNVMYGTSPVDQETFDKLVPQLQAVPGRKFLSIEPMLGPINIGKAEGIDWIICGGESGFGARPMHLPWVRDLQQQCKSLEIPFFFKQWGNWAPKSQLVGFDVKHIPNGIFTAPGDESHEDRVYMLFKSKQDAGRLLDGKLYNEMPEYLL